MNIIYGVGDKHNIFIYIVILCEILLRDSPFDAFFWYLLYEVESLSKYRNYWLCRKNKKILKCFLSGY